MNNLFLFYLSNFQVYKFVRLAELYYAGSHGMDIKGPSKSKKCNKVSSGVPCKKSIFLIFDLLAVSNIYFFLLIIG